MQCPYSPKRCITILVILLLLAFGLGAMARAGVRAIQPPSPHQALRLPCCNLEGLGELREVFITWSCKSWGRGLFRLLFAVAGSRHAHVAPLFGVAHLFPFRVLVPS